MPGTLLSFEGLDGVGKTTQIDLLRAGLSSRGIEPRAYREPGGTALGEQLREILKAGWAQGTYSELLLFVTARAELVERCVLPDLAAGRTVILDRFIDSTWAYQGARGIPDDLLEAANRLGAGGLRPDLTFWLDLDPALAATRLRTADSAQRCQYDSFEQRGSEYFQQVHQRYVELAAAQPERVRRIDASRSEAVIAEQILSITVQTLGVPQPALREEVPV